MRPPHPTTSVPRARRSTPGGRLQRTDRGCTKVTVPSWRSSGPLGPRPCLEWVSCRLEAAVGSEISLEDRYTVPGRHWHELADGRVQCDVCPRACRLDEGQRGLCFVRGRLAGQFVLTSYGRSSGFCVDPIEKKPLNRFLPGSAVL